ncbi:MAG: hypothetical protein ACLQOO_14770 [Terriglobia bacterium]
MKVSIALFLALAMTALWAGAQQPPSSDPRPQTQPAQPNSGAPAPPAAPQTGGPAAQAPSSPTVPPTAGQPSAGVPPAPPVQQEPPAPAKAAGPPLDAHGRYVVAVIIYRAAARAKDLLSLVQPDQWKMDDAARRFFDETRLKEQNAIDAVLNSSDSLAHHPEDVALGLKTRALLQTALLLLSEVADVATQYDHTGWEKQLRSSIEALNATAQPLEGDVAQPPGAAASQPPTPSAARAPRAPEPETEKVEVPKSYVAPPATLANETGTLQPAEVKQLLYRAYAAGFRFRDLLSVLEPDQWKIDAAARQSFDGTLAAVRQDLKDFENWRSQFDLKPANVFVGYKTYTAMSTALPAMDELAEDVARFQSPAAGIQFQRANEEFMGARKSLDDYLSFLLRNREQLRAAMENDLASCQNTLNYAMRGKTGPVTNMSNINPVFRGHGGRSRTAANQSQPKARNQPVSKAPARRAGSGRTAAPSNATAKGAKAGSRKRNSRPKLGTPQASGKKPGQT